MVKRSPKPFVINNAQASPFLSSKALVATVVPMRTLSIAPLFVTQKKTRMYLLFN